MGKLLRTGTSDEISDYDVDEFLDLCMGFYIRSNFTSDRRLADYRKQLSTGPFALKFDKPSKNLKYYFKKHVSRLSEKNSHRQLQREINDLRQLPVSKFLLSYYQHERVCSD
jgi:hypothetical protein